MAKIIDRAKANDKNCLNGAGQIFYSLANYGIIAEPFRSWAAGEAPDGDEDQIKKYNDAMIDIGESIIMFNDEINKDGQISI